MIAYFPHSRHNTDILLMGTNILQNFRLSLCKIQTIPPSNRKLPIHCILTGLCSASYAPARRINPAEDWIFDRINRIIFIAILRTQVGLEQCPPSDCRLYHIRRTLYPFSSSIQDMGVNHRRANIFVTQQFLNRPNIIAGLK